MTCLIDSRRTVKNQWRRAWRSWDNRFLGPGILCDTGYSRPSYVCFWPITSFGQDVEFGRYRGHSGHAPIAAGLDGVANDPERNSLARAKIGVMPASTLDLASHIFDPSEPVTELVEN
jgi:hypothetical protein